MMQREKQNQYHEILLERKNSPICVAYVLVFSNRIQYTVYHCESRRNRISMVAIKFMPIFISRQHVPILDVLNVKTAF